MEMNWTRYNRLNTLLGWVTFAIASVVYLLTIGPSASLWDCPEFILSAHSLQVGHPPGAPFYMLVYNIAAHLTSDTQLIGLYTNALSGLLSAATIMLLFWTITHLVRSVLLAGSRPLSGSGSVSPTLNQALLIFGSGLGGALLYTFTDTFWYSAVESEVYSFSSFLTALVFWLMLKWSVRADNPRSDRWLVLIAYIMGISVGVHLLNLLCIPAMALIYYYRRQEQPTMRGALLSLFISFGLIALMMYGIMQGVAAFGGTIDRWVVNGLHLSYNSGFFIYLALLILLLTAPLFLYNQGDKSRHKAIWGFLVSWVAIGIPYMGGMLWVGVLLTLAVAVVLLRTRWITTQTLHTAQLSLLVILIGISSYGVILVRSLAGTPMNQNEPNTALALKSYINREQYGAWPLLYGQTFASRPQGVSEGKAIYAPKVKATPDEPDEYVKLYNEPKVEYPSAQMMLFPRIWSTQPEHIEGYNRWLNRNPHDTRIPSMAENLTYFLRYQVNYMYWRYFGWNFIGRQNDLMGDGGMVKGGVRTGISLLDRFTYGDESALPDSLKENKGRNAYYLLPLLLGFLGIAFQLTSGRRGRQTFWITLVLFFMTGLAIILYINQTPGQPRERDYAYAASFYAYAIWIGFGITGLFELLRRARLSPTLAASCATAIGCLVAIQMASENWDDHDRSGRTLASDFGYNYLMSCEPNAILFCFGDNDTFPLWYAQEVEGVRPDVKVSNLSYLQSDWYGKQMLRATHDAAGFPTKYMTPAFFVHQPFAAVLPQGPMDYDEAMKSATQLVPYAKAVMPTQELHLALDSAQIRTQMPQLSGLPCPAYMSLSLAGKSAITRDGLFVLDMIGANHWERPIQWVISSPPTAFSNLSQYLSQCGMAQRLNPISVAGTPEQIETDRMYDLVMHQFRYFHANDPNIYFDENIRRNISYYYRSRIFNTLARALLSEDKPAQALEVLKKCRAVISPQAVPYGITDIDLAETCCLVGYDQLGDEILSSLYKDAAQTLYWVSIQRPSYRAILMTDPMVQYSLASLMELIKIEAVWHRGIDTAWEAKLEAALPYFGTSYHALKKITQEQYTKLP